MLEASHLGFLASSVARRRVSVRFSAASDELAYSDGHAIILPAGGHQEPAEAWWQVVSQGLLLSMGSLDVVAVRRLIGRPRDARRFAFLEVLRGLEARSAELPSAFTRMPAFDNRPAAPSSTSESLLVALRADDLGEVPTFVGTVRPLAVLRESFGLEGGGAPRQEHAADTRRMPEVTELADEEETERSILVRLFASPTGASNPFQGLLNTLLGARGGRASQQQAEGGGGEMPVGRVERAARRGVHAIRAAMHLEASDAEGEARAFRYPEWDEIGHRYRRGWTCVEEVEPWRPDGPSAVQASLTATSRALLRQLSGLGVHHEMHRGQADGIELDIGRMLECAIDLRAGFPPAHQDVYRASRKTRRDLGIVILVDVSGSTEERNAAGESVFQNHLQVACQLGAALHRLGDRVAVYGFQSWGRTQVRLARVKGHGEPWGGHVIARFAQLEAQGYTRTGAAIRHAEHLLRRDMRLPSRLIVLVTDGFPYDQDYEGLYAEGDTRMALTEARTAGTACVCLCIGGGQARDRLAAVFGAANILAVERPDDVGRRIRSTFSGALASVSHRSLSRRRRRAQPRGYS
jgi:nitric oxide reductase NorD protein